MLICPFLLSRAWSPIPELCQDNSKNYMNNVRTAWTILKHGTLYPPLSRGTFEKKNIKKKQFLASVPWSSQASHPSGHQNFLRIRTQMPQSQGMNWNFLEALPNAVAMRGEAAKLVSGRLFPVQNFPVPVGGLVLITNMARVGGMW